MEDLANLLVRGRELNAPSTFDEPSHFRARAPGSKGYRPQSVVVQTKTDVDCAESRNEAIVQLDVQLRIDESEGRELLFNLLDL
jgi:hypothetical protein